MENTSDYQQKQSRRPRRRQLPRPIIGLALLVALIIAAIGAAMTQSAPSRPMGLPAFWVSQPPPGR
jgi:hypothetical protein